MDGLSEGRLLGAALIDGFVEIDGDVLIDGLSEGWFVGDLDIDGLPEG